MFRKWSRSINIQFSGSTAGVGQRYGEGYMMATKRNKLIEIM